jgi:hypothetical protein
MGQAMSAYQTFGPLFDNPFKFTMEYTEVGEQLRDQGIKQVSEHNENWMANTIALASYYAQFHVGDFTGEDIRNYCERKFSGSPKHQNAWGALINTLIKRKIIVPTGEYRQMKDKTSHARKTPVYKAAVTQSCVPRSWRDSVNLEQSP